MAQPQKCAIKISRESIRYAVFRLRVDAPVPRSMLFPDSGFKNAESPLLHEFLPSNLHVFWIALLEATNFVNLSHLRPACSSYWHLMECQVLFTLYTYTFLNSFRHGATLDMKNKNSVKYIFLVNISIRNTCTICLQKTVSFAKYQVFSVKY